MSYPATITPWNSAIYNYYNVGPFEYGSAIYCVMLRRVISGTAFVHVFKSTDQGITWTEADSGNVPQRRNGGAISENCAACLVGSVLYITYGAPGDILAVGRFDCATDTWASSWVSSFPMTAAFGYQDGGGFQSSLVLRSTDSTFVIAFKGSHEVMTLPNETRDRIWWCTCDLSGAFGNLNMILAAGVRRDYSLAGLVELTGGRVLVFGAGWTNSYTDEDLYCAVVTSSNTITGPFTATSNIGLATYTNFGAPVRYGNEAWIPYLGSTNIVRVCKATSADAPSFSDESIESGVFGGSPYTAFYPGTIAVVNGDAYYSWLPTASWNYIHGARYTSGAWQPYRALLYDPGVVFDTIRSMSLTGAYGIISLTYSSQPAIYAQFPVATVSSQRAYIA